jgi:hypothetical protein
MGSEIIVIRLNLVYRVDGTDRHSMKKLHLALSTDDIAASVADFLGGWDVSRRW